MTRRIGLLSISVTALGLAVAGYFAQGAGAETSPVEVADFGLPLASVAASGGGDEYDMAPGDIALFHATGSRTAAPCQDGAGLSTLKLSDGVGMICLDGDVLGFLVTAKGQAPKIVKQVDLRSGQFSDETCPTQKDEVQPDA